MQQKNFKTFLIEGMKDGIPIGIGYFAVSFSLGIAGKNAGLSIFQGFLASLLCNASAGEYAGFRSIAANAPYIETIIITIIANCRYFLMSCAMSQRISPKTSVLHRLLMSFYLTDELFGIAMARKGSLNPYYTYGAVLIASPCWAVGTALGAAAGEVLPGFAVSALSVALFGMFLAVIIPPAKKDKIIAGVVAVCFISSFLSVYLPILSDISEGVKVIVLTVVISSAAAVIFPHTEEKEILENA